MTSERAGTALEPSDKTAWPWWSNEVWDRVSFTWDLWYGCNYRCSYCWWEMDNLWAELAKKHRILPPEQWIACWDRIYDLYGTTRVDVLGGEPLRYPSWKQLFEGLSRRHRVSITTNLSVSMEDLREMTDRVSPERIHFAASYHPQFAKWEDFIDKIGFLKKRGYFPHVLVVAWPPLLKDLARWSDFFKKMDIPFTTSVFQGKHEGREYPDSYTAEEKALLGLNIPIVEEQRYRLERDSTQGKLCGAGHVYANIKGNGDVYRCGQDCLGGAKPLGNIFDADFGLHASPAPCPYKHCSCGEFAFLWEDWTRKKGRLEFAVANSLRRQETQAGELRHG